ncbi:winged helix-turn-helix transcriptional regulator [Lacticaseibacillus paracasei]|uniref:winged helix-turn-helix transcriptional regulator n=1 Tax=Lacticaseibacillus paracasei TaxID=1597 RepID=UPI00235F2F4D|nr:helix-turn-helix domain-containing protein [Lacticaseibacillus paracasei]
MMPSCSSTQNQPCPATRLLQKISGKWKGIILYRFIQQSNWHFGELNASVSPCPTRMLARQLAQLCADGFIQKHILTTQPLVTTYHLTAEGMALKPIILAIAQREGYSI